MKRGFDRLEHLPSRQRFRQLPRGKAIDKTVRLDDGSEWCFGSWNWDSHWLAHADIKHQLGDKYDELLQKWEVKKQEYLDAWRLEDAIYKSEVRHRDRANKHLDYFSKGIKRLRAVGVFIQNLNRLCTPKRYTEIGHYLEDPYYIELTHKKLPCMTISTNVLIRSIYEDVYKPLLSGKLKVDRARVAIQAMQQICHMAELQLAYEASRRVGSDITVDMLENRA
jgi:hypothetical protein